MSLVIRNAADVLAYCNEQNKTLYETAIDFELAKGIETREEIMAKMHRHYKAMEESVREGLKGTEEGACKMFRDDAKRLMAYREQKMTLSGQTMTKAAAYALAVMEVNCSMGRIVAAPTAGSCGVLPAVITASMETLKKMKRTECTPC